MNSPNVRGDQAQAAGLPASVMGRNTIFCWAAEKGVGAVVEEGAAWGG